MDLKMMIDTMHDEINSSYLREHEAEYIEKAYKKIVYSGRDPDAAEIKTIKKMYQMYLKRKLQE